MHECASNCHKHMGDKLKIFIDDLRPKSARYMNILYPNPQQTRIQARFKRHCCKKRRHTKL